MCTFYIENDAEIFPVQYTWKVAEKWFKMGEGKTTLVLSASFHDGNGFIWQDILT